MYKDFKKTESLDTGFVGGSGILWMFSGIVLGLLVGLGMYYFSNVNTSANAAKANEALRATEQKNIKQEQFNRPASTPTIDNISIVNDSQKNMQVPQKQKEDKAEGNFSFYAVLPNIDVPVASKALDTSTRVEKSNLAKPPEPKGKNKSSVKKSRKGNYVLQVASFKRKSSANTALRQLAKRGVNARIQKKKIRGRLWYRISTGPADKVSVDRWRKKAEKLGHKPQVFQLKN